MNKQTIRDILDMRQTTHGDYTDFANIWDLLLHVYESSPNWETLTPYQRCTLRMKANKHARILAGDPNFLDHWIDDNGYGQLAIDRLSEFRSRESVEATVTVATREHVERIVPRQNLVSVEHPPWVIQTVMPLLDPRQHWYKSIGNGLYVLEPWVALQGDELQPPPDLYGFYVYWPFYNETAGWLLKIEDCPPEIRDRWDTYPDDRTEAEYRHIWTWERGLYDLKGDRYQLKPQCKAWGRGE